MISTGRRSIVGWLAPVAASVFVLVFAVVRGTTDSMWFDEAFSYDAATKSLSALVEMIWRREANMGPYYLVLWGWIRVDDGDLWIRSLSAVCTVVAVWGVWVVVRRWSGPGPAGLAAVVLALTPFVLAWSIQARGYAMAMAATAWSLVFADRIRSGAGRWDGVVFGVLAGLAVAVQLSTAFVFVGVVVALVVLAPSGATMRSLVMATLAAVVVFAPFAVAVVRNHDQIDWIPPVTLDRFGTEVLRAASGPYWAGVVALGLISLVVGISRDVRLRPYLLALAGVASGVVGLVVISVVATPMYLDRYFIGCLPVVVVAAVGGWSVLWSRWRVTSVAVVVGLAVVILLVSIDTTRPPDEDYRSAAEVVIPEFRPGDELVAFGGWGTLGLLRYLPAGTPLARVVESSEVPGALVVARMSGEAVRPARIWMMDRGSTRPEIRRWIDTTYPVVMIDEQFGDVRLQLRALAPTTG